MSVRRRIPPLPTIQELIKVYKLSAQKKLSQNFLLNQAAIRRLVKCAGNLNGHHVCEVGPGPGGITRELLRADIKKLVVVEKDVRFLPILRSLAYAYQDTDKKMQIFHGDILKFNMTDLFPEEEIKDWNDSVPNLSIIGNLPFNISTPLIIKWLADISNKEGAWRYGRTKLTLTFQKEVGERMVADILDKQRSRLSVMCQYLCDVKFRYTISGKAFTPSPEVDVAVVHFVPRKTPMIHQPFVIVEKVVRHTFHYRQKHCRKGLLSLFPPELSKLCDEMLRICDVDPTTRPQQLSIEEFSKLCDVYAGYCQMYEGLFQYYYRDPSPSEVISIT